MCKPSGTGVGGDESKVRNPMVGLHNCPKSNKGVGLVATAKN